MFLAHKNNETPEIKREKSLEELKTGLKEAINLGLGKNYEAYANEVEGFFEENSQDIISWMLNNFELSFQALKFSKVLASSELCGGNNVEKLSTDGIIKKESWMADLPKCRKFNTVDLLYFKGTRVKIELVDESLIAFLFYIGVKTEIIFDKSNKEVIVIFRFYEDLTEKLMKAKKDKSFEDHLLDVKKSVLNSMGADYADYAKKAERFWEEKSDAITEWLVKMFVAEDKGLKFTAIYGNGHGNGKYEDRIISRLIPIEEWMSDFPSVEQFNRLPKEELSLSVGDVHFITNDTEKHMALMAFLYYIGLKNTSSYDMNVMNNWTSVAVKYILTFNQEISFWLLKIKNI